MRYYFVNQDMKEFSIDAELTPGVIEFTHEGKKSKLWVKRLAGKNYYSFDEISWKKLPALGVNEVLVSNSEVYKVFRGYKPSGLNKGGAGALITQMPGKIVKIMKKVGDQVTKGETVLILEAMKMENIIKAPADVVIKSIKVKSGDKVEKNQVMIVFA